MFIELIKFGYNLVLKQNASRIISEGLQHFRYQFSEGALNQKQFPHSQFSYLPFCLTSHDLIFPSFHHLLPVLSRLLGAAGRAAGGV